VTEVMQNVCARMGTENFLTSPYTSQTDGMIERFNATLCRDLAKFVTHEEDWDRRMAFAVYHCNATVTRQMVCHRFVPCSA
jgi:transposase InsO family protein